MKIEVTGVSVSKKGTVWIQAKQLTPAIPAEPVVGDVFHCEYVGKAPKKVKEKTSDEETQAED